jgi:DNA-binding CsgD family transcriptional regulator
MVAARKTQTVVEAGNKSSQIRSDSGVGILLLDGSLNPIWFNIEAIQILSYPQKPDRANAPDADALGAKIRARLGEQSLRSPSLTEFTSGRRRYLCRAFFLKSHVKGNSVPSVAVLLERSPRATITLSEACVQFQLTRRERETLEFLSVGLDTKEIANCMQISTNTAKVYIRMVMAKMGVSSRLGVLAKILAIKAPTKSSTNLPG